MNVSDINPLDHRQASTAGVESAFVARWSPRAMSGEPVAQGSIDILFEAARWSPSCFNAQPWRFLYTHRASKDWPLFFDALVEGNQSWVASAGVLIAVLSRTHYERNEEAAPTHEFDAGAAWMSIALQASKLNLVAHAMRGFDSDRARASLQIPALYHLNAMIAIGHPGALENLSDSQREREIPSDRKALEDIVFQGAFPTA